MRAQILIASINIVAPRMAIARFSPLPPESCHILR
jgi:hypothetical protein